ncbi:hypothetical protein GIB67_037956 [Kingdonia uniflora]|uniref:RRM domain-containing protein n=1 Tax=Kingdonia uniflora TaxID=39325 RepID=A0A7J7LHF6_9MAGN|nr:hypothetical protein GIB67_037956 [Kingdonia uniflora]
MTNNTEDEESRTLWMGGIHEWVDEMFIWNCFRPSDEVLSVKIMRNKLPGQPGYGYVEFVSCGAAERGYGFVKFTNEVERNRAMSEMNGVYCSGRPMHISSAVRKGVVSQQTYTAADKRNILHYVDIIKFGHLFLKDITISKLTISAGHLFTNNAHLIWESLRKVYSQLENNARIFQLSNEIENFKQGTQTLGMYYARVRLSWEELSHYDSFIEWPASAPSEKVPIPPTVAEIYAKIVEKTRVFQFLAGLNPDFEYARVHLPGRTLFPTLEEAHAYCLSDQSRRSPMPPISGIPSETSTMAVCYAYPAPPSVPSQTSHTSSPSLSPLLAASGNSRPLRKKCDYCGK